MRILHVQRKEKLQYSPNFDQLTLENWPCFDRTQIGAFVSDANQDRVSTELNIVALF
jgi:hypothetical protein